MQPRMTSLLCLKRSLALRSSFFSSERETLAADVLELHTHTSGASKLLRRDSTQEHNRASVPTVAEPPRHRSESSSPPGCGGSASHPKSPKVCLKFGVRRVSKSEPHLAL